MSASNKPIVNVRFVNMDISRVSVDAVATGEGPDLETESFVTTSLMKASPHFRAIRNELKKKNIQELKFGKVLHSFLGEPNSVRNRLNFKYVLHAVLDGTIISKKPKWVIDQMECLYCNIFEVTENLSLYSVAVPLLGTGAFPIDASLAIEALAKAIVNTNFDYLTDLMVVCTDEVFLNSAKQHFIFQWQGQIKRGFHRLLLDGAPIESMESQADKDRQPHQRSKTNTVPADTHSGRTSNTRYISTIYHTPAATGYDRGRRSVEDIRHNFSAVDLSHSKQHSGRYEDVDNQAISPSKRPLQKDRCRSFKGNHRHREDPKQSDEQIARSMQNKEESLSGKSVEDEYSKLACKGQNRGSRELFEKDENEKDLKASASKDDDQKETCSICLNTISDQKKLNKCGHVFCRGCIDRSFQDYKPVCPTCNMVYGEVRGNQPDGQMDVGFSDGDLPGYEGHGSITITYSFPDGIQQRDHPRPGRPYYGTTRFAYLPNNKEGKKILALLRKAFDRKLTFTIGRSTTTGRDGVITWNDIHHKTSIDGGPSRFGYPDPTYLSRVRDELASKGVTE